MTGQLSILPPAPPRPPTPRQQLILDAVTASREGIDEETAGTLTHEARGIHGRAVPCRYCGQEGRGILRELAKKGYVSYRRKRGQTAGAWVAVGAVVEPDAGFGEVPY